MRSSKSADYERDRVSEFETMPAFLLNHIVHKYNHILQSRLRSVGVSPLQMRIILSLNAHGRLTVGELCNFAIAEQPTMSRALDSLEAQGLVRREMSESDSRLRLITLTDKGMSVHDDIRPVVMGMNEAMLAGQAGEQREDLIRQLGTMLVSLQRL
ncbi:MAG: MarR family transcriptional regulator [Paracoccus denitrificans]|uniref:MarR family transcriptional regulator n=1 Tax=Paracoccus denitrificans TaxID=266 RepID=A0A533IAJ1_PARDE|nr:MAG: MarR family transcriptional regulator [Paracoccus denitrificans]